MTTGLTEKLSTTDPMQEKAITCPHCMGLLFIVVDTFGRGASGRGSDNACSIGKVIYTPY